MRVHQNLDAGAYPHIITDPNDAYFGTLQSDDCIGSRSVIVIDDLNESPHQNIISNTNLVFCGDHTVPTDHRITSDGNSRVRLCKLKKRMILNDALVSDLENGAIRHPKFSIALDDDA